MAMSRNIVLLQPVTSAAFDPAQTRFMRSGNTGAPLDRMKEDITMKDLLPFVERELSLFGDYFRRFAEEYPAIAGELKLQSDSGGDPDIRRFTQAAAVLNARTAKKLDDDYPELTSSFLDMLAPHLLRPFPSCSIARFDGAGSHNTTEGGATTIPRGTVLKTTESNRDGNICKFRSVYPVTLAPLSIVSACFHPVFRAPADTH